MRGVQEIAARIVAGVLDAADPERAVDRAWPVALESAERVTLVAAGKASVAMARAAVGRLGDRLNGGVVVGPWAVVDGWAARPAGLEVFAADHPIPTTRNVEAGERVRRAASACRSDGTLLVLISGGASAYLTLPGEGVTLADIARVTDALLRAGATIREVNAVRKHGELLKGGGLARAAAGAGEVWSLVLSDVLGDPLDAIGSGPTAADPTTFADALGVLGKYAALDVSPAVRVRLERGARGEIEETCKPGDDVVERVRHVIVANNAVAVGSAAGVMRGLGFEVVETRLGVEGEAGEVGRALAARVRALRRDASGRASCVVGGGETTVTVGETVGGGGRVQEGVLAAAIEVEGVAGAGVVGIATDGVDGPTDACGAAIDGGTVGAMREMGVDAAEALRRHDSNTALAGVGALIRTGPTGTNVNDVLVGFVAPAEERPGSGMLRAERLSPGGPT
ncbi:MAG: DUF4147 domain-containing protein [Phycisphaerales bacterium]